MDLKMCAMKTAPSWLGKPRQHEETLLGDTKKCPKNANHEPQVVCLSYTLFSLERGITEHSYYMFLFHTLAHQTVYIQNHGA